MAAAAAADAHAAAGGKPYGKHGVTKGEYHKHVGEAARDIVGCQGSRWKRAREVSHELWQEHGCDVGAHTLWNHAKRLEAAPGSRGGHAARNDDSGGGGGGGRGGGGGVASPRQQRSGLAARPGGGVHFLLCVRSTVPATTGTVPAAAAVNVSGGAGTRRGELKRPGAGEGIEFLTSLSAVGRCRLTLG